MKTLIYAAIAGLGLLTASCDDFLDNNQPKGVVTDDEIEDPRYVDNLVISAYAIWVTGDDINSSFSLWNYDVRSDDCYKGGSGTEDGGVFNALETSRGINTTDWNINDIWKRLYQCITRANTALKTLDQMDESTYPEKQQRIAEMRFLRGHAHFMLKELYKNIVFVTDENLPADNYTELSNTTYSNDEGWQVIAEDFKFAYDNLPLTQTDKGRPTKAAAAAYLAKTYLYKAYHQDDTASNQVTGINTDDLKKVVEYADLDLMKQSGFGLESDYVNNFLPETENGVESIWAYQYSMNDGTYTGNLNWGMGLCTPLIIGGTDFHKPSQNMVNAFRTDSQGYPLFDTFNNSDYDAATDNADPRLFHTCAMPGYPFKYNSSYMVEQNDDWSRSKGLYGYYMSLKENVDIDSEYLIKGSYWASPMNHIVLRYADVMLFRAEALIQLNDGRIAEAVDLINQLRERAAASLSKIYNYTADYGVSFKCSAYKGSYNQEDALRLLKWERRLEFGCEGSRFFDLVRWGDVADVIGKYYTTEASRCSIYTRASFNKNKNEYLPIPFEQVSASNGHYTQNIGWN